MSAHVWPNVVIIRFRYKVVECVKAHIKIPNVYKKQNIVLCIYRLYMHTIQRDVDTCGAHLQTFDLQ